MSCTVQSSFEDGTPASVAIIETICSIEDIDPMMAPNELDSILFDHVDAEALDTLVDSENAPELIRIEFEFERYHVRITKSGYSVVTISITEY